MLYIEYLYVQTWFCSVVDNLVVQLKGGLLINMTWK